MFLVIVYCRCFSRPLSTTFSCAFQRTRPFQFFTLFGSSSLCLPLPGRCTRVLAFSVKLSSPIVVSSYSIRFFCSIFLWLGWSFYTRIRNKTLLQRAVFLFENNKSFCFDRFSIGTLSPSSAKSFSRLATTRPTLDLPIHHLDRVIPAQWNEKMRYALLWRSVHLISIVICQSDDHSQWRTFMTDCRRSIAIFFLSRALYFPFPRNTHGHTLKSNSVSRARKKKTTRPTDRELCTLCKANW